MDNINCNSTPWKGRVKMETIKYSVTVHHVLPEEMSAVILRTIRRKEKREHRREIINDVVSCIALIASAASLYFLLWLILGS